MSVNLNNLPEDIFRYNYDQFYEFIKQRYGNDLSELVRFQSIRNGEDLLSSSSDEILLILQQESEEINHLRKNCCFQVAGNKYEVKLGIKLAINNLIQLLKMKQEQQTMKKQSLTEHSLFNLDTMISTNQKQLQHDIFPLASTFSIPSTIHKSLTQPRRRSRRRSLNKVGHTIEIERRVSKWCSKHDVNENVPLKRGTDYFLQISKLISDEYTCLLTCKCRRHFRLPNVKAGRFKLSSYYRHIMGKRCLKPLKGSVTPTDTISRQLRSSTIQAARTEEIIVNKYGKCIRKIEKLRS